MLPEVVPELEPSLKANSEGVDDTYSPFDTFKITPKQSFSNILHTIWGEFCLYKVSFGIALSGTWTELFFHNQSHSLSLCFVSADSNTEHFFHSFFFIWKLCREFKYQAQKLTPYATSCWGRKGVPQWTVLLFLTFEQPTANGLTGHGLEKFQGSFRGSHWPKLLDFVQKLFLTEQAIS